jgi:hypothetical protein
MIIPTVVVISCMWLPVALLFFGKGEAKGTGFITGVVGALVLICSIVHAAVFKDPVLPTLLFMHGTFHGAGRFEIRGKCQPRHGDCVNYLHDYFHHRRAGYGRRHPTCCPEQLYGSGLRRVCRPYLHGMAQCVREVFGQSHSRFVDRLGGRGSVDSGILADGCRQIALLVEEGGNRRIFFRKSATGDDGAPGDMGCGAHVVRNGSPSRQK